MKKNPIPNMNETRANRNGNKASMFKKAGIVKNARDTIIKTTPTAKSNFCLSIFLLITFVVKKS